LVILLVPEGHGHSLGWKVHGDVSLELPESDLLRVIWRVQRYLNTSGMVTSAPILIMPGAVGCLYCGSGEYQTEFWPHSLSHLTVAPWEACKSLNRDVMGDQSVTDLFGENPFRAGIKRKYTLSFESLKCNSMFL
jgi:hypothetical protein